jgi:hypothetical protein
MRFQHFAQGRRGIDIDSVKRRCGKGRGADYRRTDYQQRDQPACKKMETVGNFDRLVLR